MYFPVCRVIKDLQQRQDTTHEVFVPLYFEAGDALQFDGSQAVVVFGGVEQTIKVTHFRLCHSRKPCLFVYLRETQEMLLDAFVETFTVYQGLLGRLPIDNPKAMVIHIGRGKVGIVIPALCP